MMAELNEKITDIILKNIERNPTQKADDTSGNCFILKKINSRKMPTNPPFHKDIGVKVWLQVKVIAFRCYNVLSVKGRKYS